MGRERPITKILILASEPTDAARLRLGREVREIQNSLRQSNSRDQFEIVQSWATRPRDLRQQILNDHPTIVHFIGHGAGVGGLALEDDNGKTHLVSTDALAELFQLFKNDLECVVLNSCFSGVQAEVIGRYIPYVVGMKQEIGDEAAIDFSTGFYDALFGGKSFEQSFEFGRNAIHLENLPDPVKSEAAGRELGAATAGALESIPEHLKPILTHIVANVGLRGDEGSQKPANSRTSGFIVWGGRVQPAVLAGVTAAVVFVAVGFWVLANKDSVINTKITETNRPTETAPRRTKSQEFVFNFSKHNQTINYEMPCDFVVEKSASKVVDGKDTFRSTTFVLENVGKVVHITGNYDPSKRPPLLVDVSLKVNVDAEGR